LELSKREENEMKRMYGDTDKPVVNEKLITIEVKGGCVINVSGMPEDYFYEIKDHDVVDDERKIYYA
tara:strand:+ start:73 stop:273 length:201 start_codon:yes stop_codon:yes gene_type:complete